MPAFVLHLLSRLPLRVLHALGALLGWAVYWASPTYRRHLRANLEQALGTTAPRGTLHDAIGHAGRTFTELAKVWALPQEEVVRHVVRVSGWDLVESALQRDRGIIFLTPHLGCFEITAQYYAAHAPITVLYRPPRQTWLQPVIEEGRGSRLKLARADVGGVRTLLRALKRHEAIGMLPDQVPAFGEGIWAAFFDRPAYTMTLAARFAEITDATLLFAYAERLPGGDGFHLHLSQPPQALAGTLEQRVEAINAALEALILRCPAQYLWGYNRYKRPSGVAAPVPPEAGA